MNAAGTAASETRRSAKVGRAFQPAHRAGTTTKDPSANRWATVALTVSPSTGMLGATIPTKAWPRTRPSPKLCKPTNATASQRMRGGGNQPNPKREEGKPRPRAPPPRPLRGAPRGDVIDHGESGDGEGCARHDLGDQRERGPWQRGGRSPDD